MSPDLAFGVQPAKRRLGLSVTLIVDLECIWIGASLPQNNTNQDANHPRAGGMGIARACGRWMTLVLLDCYSMSANTLVERKFGLGHCC